MNHVCAADECGEIAVVGLAYCQDHAEECDCPCAVCQRRGVHYAHREDAADYGEPCFDDRRY